MRIAITGHRPNKLGNDYNLTSPLIQKIKKELQIIIDTYQPKEMISGMALGIDTLWAQLAHENKIPLTAAIPCINQEKLWKDRHKHIYYNLLQHPLTTQHYVSTNKYTHYCMHDRNEWMVKNCDVLVAVWDGSSGGTEACIKAAKIYSDAKIIIINPKDL